MTDYTKLVQALRCEELKGIACPDCYERECIANSGKVLYCRVPQLLEDAAAAIEALEARLGEAENSVERWKDMYLTKHEPKRGEFEKSLHEMFDSIWDCDINHPIFQDTVGELMEAVLQAYDTVNRAKMEAQDGQK